MKQMNNNGSPSRGRRIVDYATVAIEEMKRYCALRPDSPSTVRRPKLFVRGDLWIALLGPSLEEGIVGIGPTVGAALRAFDAQYLIARRPRNERATNSTKSRWLLRRATTAAE